MSACAFQSTLCDRPYNGLIIYQRRAGAARISTRSQSTSTLPLAAYQHLSIRKPLHDLATLLRNIARCSLRSLQHTEQWSGPWLRHRRSTCLSRCSQPILARNENLIRHSDEIEASIRYKSLMSSGVHATYAYSNTNDNGGRVGRLQAQ